MFEEEIAKYNACLIEYQEKIVRRFAPGDMKEYNEILFYDNRA